MIEDNNAIDYRDLLIILNNRTKLIARVIQGVVDEDNNPIENSYFMYEPHELIRLSDGRLIMIKWIDGTCDKIIPISTDKILTIANPDDELLEYYLQRIGVIPESLDMPSQSIH